MYVKYVDITVQTLYDTSVIFQTLTEAKLVQCQPQQYYIFGHLQQHGHD